MAPRSRSHAHSSAIGRRAFIGGLGAVGGMALTAGVTGRAALGSPLRRVLAQATATTACGGLDQVEHVVMFMHENRSFDQYFGTYPGVRGFADPSGTFSVPWPDGVAPGGHLLPYRVPLSAAAQACGLGDPTHDWDPQHQSWNGGAMDGWYAAHQSDDVPWGTMGCFERADVPFLHAVADAFTICDGYHSSVIGPTDPNHLYWLSATLDPDGTHGGPVTETLGCRTTTPYESTFTWQTMPDALEAAGVSWAFYGSPTFTPYAFTTFFQTLNGPLASKAVEPTFDDFLTAAGTGTLPQVSWVVGRFPASEHEPYSPTAGEAELAAVIDALSSNEAQWAKTVRFYTYDENGGFFDHVPPPVAPPGTPGEYVTAPPPPYPGCTQHTVDTSVPIGLGFRVPTLVISPFSRGGLVCSDTFDHTSMLRFVETRFGVEVPNLTAWRRGVTGDLTAALDLAVTPQTALPPLPAPQLIPACTTTTVPEPTEPQVLPAQPVVEPRRPSGCVVAPSPVTPITPLTPLTPAAPVAVPLPMTPSFTG